MLVTIPLTTSLNYIYDLGLNISLHLSKVNQSFQAMSNSNEKLKPFNPFESREGWTPQHFWTFNVCQMQSPETSNFGSELIIYVGREQLNNRVKCV